MFKIVILFMALIQPPDTIRPVAFYHGDMTFKSQADCEKKKPEIVMQNAKLLQSHIPVPLKGAIAKCVTTKEADELQQKYDAAVKQQKEMRDREKEI